MYLLDPLEIDDGHDADLEIRVAAGVDVIGDDRAVQALVEQEVAPVGERLPRCERAGRRLVKVRIDDVVHVVASGEHAGLAVGLKDLGELIKKVRV